jgi:hypothetical protein
LLHFPPARDYFELELNYEKLLAENADGPRLFIDEAKNRIIFLFHHFGSSETHQGTAIFSLSVDALSERLKIERQIRIDENIVLIENPKGFLYGVTNTLERLLISQVSSNWENSENWRTGDFRFTRLNLAITNSSPVLVSTRTSQGFFVGRIVNEELFLLPEAMKLIILVSFFLTMYLTILLLFNLRQDPVTIILNRLKLLQISLTEQFYEHKDKMNPNFWRQELEVSRARIREQIKQGIRITPNNDSENIDALINSSLDELILVLAGRGDTDTDEEKIKKILDRMFSYIPNISNTVAPVQVSIADQASLNQSPGTKTVNTYTGEGGLLKKAMAIVEKTEEVEELEELEELYELEALDELDEEDAADPPETPSPVNLRDKIEKLANEIEFSPIPEPESADDEHINEDWEIVSPFSSMLSDFEGSKKEVEDDTEKNISKTSTANLENEVSDLLEEVFDDELQEAELEGDFNRQHSLIHKPFQNISGNTQIDILEALPNQDVDGIIKEREGVPYISDKAIKPSSKAAAPLNRDFKDLVDSVIK